MNIHAAIFDIGNVLLSFDYEKAFRRFEGADGSPDHAARAELLALRDEFEIGGIGTAEFIARGRRIFPRVPSDQEFVGIWEDIFEENEAIFGLIQTLEAAMPLYLLSNTNAIHRESIERKYPVFARFQAGVYSYEAGLMKPSPGIFHKAARLLNVDPSRTIYLDDMPANVAAARACGFIAFQYDLADHARSEAEIQGLLDLRGVARREA